MVAKLVENLLRLEGREDGLDQRGGPDGTLGDAQLRLRVDEHVVPESGLEMALHFRKVEIGARSARQELAGVVEEIQPEIEKASADGLPAEKYMLLGKMPAAGAHEQRGRLLVQLVGLALGTCERDRAPHGVAQVDVAIEQVFPGGRRGVLEVGHEHLRARIEGVDDHLAVDGPGDLGPAVEKVGGRGGHFPGALTDRLGRREEIRERARIQLGLARDAAGEQLLAARFKRAEQAGQKGAGLGRQDFRIGGGNGPANFEAGDRCGGQIGKGLRRQRLLPRCVLSPPLYRPGFMPAAQLKEHSTP